MIFNFSKKRNINFYKEKGLYDEWATTKNAESYFSYIDRLPNPDTVLRKTGKRISVFRSLVNHYQVGTCIESRKAGTLSQKWELKENDTVKTHYAFYKAVFKNIDVYKLIEAILEAPLYGYQPIEIQYAKEGNYIYPVKIQAKPQDWFFFNSDGKFFFRDRNYGGKREINIEDAKFLLPRNKADYENPYGQAILSRCFWNVAFINGGMEFWIRFTEKLGMPYIFGKYPRGMTDIEKENMLTALVNMVQDAIGIIPNDGSVEVMQTGTTGNAEIYEKLINKCEANISKSILGQTLTTDVGSVGSYAASKTHFGVRSDIVNSDKRLVEQTINEFIRKLNYLNFNDESVPEFTFVEEDLGLAKAERDTKVSSLGVKFSENYIIRTYGYQKGDIKIVDTAQFPNNINFSDTDESSDKLINTDFDNLEKITEKEDLNNLIEPEIKKITDFFTKTNNAEETLDKLGELYPQLNAKQLENMLTKVIFISELLGRLNGSHLDGK
jgi:phage gp29-like protein